MDRLVGEYEKESSPLYSDSEEYSSSNEDDDVDEVDLISDKLDISEELANSNYDSAGVEVEEEKEMISVEKQREVIDPVIDLMLDEIVLKLEMPYQPADFQRVAVNALGQMKSVVLVSPTGSGKMNVPLLAIEVLRKQLKKPKGSHSYSSLVHLSYI